MKKIKFPRYCPKCGRNLVMRDVCIRKSFDKFTGKRNPDEYSFSLLCDNPIDDLLSGFYFDTEYQEDFGEISKESYLKLKRDLLK